jgi:membrane protein YdbS with pleckstrin-like domain
MALVRLHPDEAILLDVQPSRWWTAGKLVFSLGLWAIWRRKNHFYLTNERVLHCKGIISKSEQAVPLSRIQDCKLVRSILTGGRVILSTAGGPLGFEHVGPLTRADALIFADALTPLMGHDRGL